MYAESIWIASMFNFLLIFLIHLLLKIHSIRPISFNFEDMDQHKASVFRVLLVFSKLLKVDCFAFAAGNGLPMIQGTSETQHFAEAILMVALVILVAKTVLILSRFHCEKDLQRVFCF